MMKKTPIDNGVESHCMHDTMRLKAKEHPAVATTLALASLEGWCDLPIDAEDAKKLLINAAHQGCSDANYMLGNPFYKLDYPEPQQCLEFAARSGHEGARQLLEFIRQGNEDAGDYYRTFQYEEDEDKIKSLIDSASSGNADARCTLFIYLPIFFSRYGKENHKFDAIKLLEKSEQWFEQAKATSGRARYLSISSFSSIEEKISSLKSAACPEDGVSPYPAALVDIAFCYIKDNFEEAERFLKLAIESNTGNIQKKANLVLAQLILSHPNEVKSSVNEAIKICDELASDVGFDISGENESVSDASFLLGRCYLRGQGVPADPQEAKSLFEKSKTKSNERVYPKVALDLGWGTSLFYPTKEILIRRLDDLSFSNEQTEWITEDDVELLLNIWFAGNEHSITRGNYPDNAGLSLIKLMVKILSEQQVIQTAWLRNFDGCEFFLLDKIFKDFVLACLFLTPRMGVTDLIQARKHIDLALSAIERFDDELPGVHFHEIGRWVKKRISTIQEVIFQKEKNEAVFHAQEQAKKEMLSFLSHTLTNSVAGSADSLRRIAKSLTSLDADDPAKRRRAAERLAGMVASFSLTESLVDSFKLYASDPEALQTAWENDVSGEVSLKRVIALAMRQSLSRFFFSAEHARDFNRILPGEDYKSLSQQFIENAMGFDLDDDSGAVQLFAWMNSVLPIFSLTIDAGDQVHISRGGARYVVIFSIISECLTNSLKYSNGSQVIELNCTVESGGLNILCVNPFDVNSSNQSRGGRKGLTFMYEICRLIGAQFEEPITENGEYRVNVHIPM